MKTSTARNIPPTLAAGLRLFIMLAFPVILVLSSVRLVMTETFVRLEYHRPGFPADRYGFSQDERLTYAPYAIRYLLENKEIDYLADLEYGGEPLFRDKELRHMEDVQTVTRVAFRLHAVLLLAFALAFTTLAWQPSTHATLRRGLASGGVLTIGLILTLITSVVVNWDFFFDRFHMLFFEGDTWLFSTSDSLIRLFPDQFWFDAALTIGVLTAAGAVGTVLGVWYWERRLYRRAWRANQNGAENGPTHEPENQA